MITRGYKGKVLCKCHERFTGEAIWQEIDGYFYGKYLAIHHNLDDFVGGYTITHVPSGYRLEIYSYAKDAKAVALRLANSKVNWAELTVENCHDENGQRAVKAMQLAKEEVLGE